jgi:hypothetical protein
MADTRAKKITELDSVGSVQSTDLLVVVAGVASNNANTYSITVKHFANSIIVPGTPANSTIIVSSGTFMYNSNYLYIAIADNLLKRVAISSF